MNLPSILLANNAGMGVVGFQNGNSPGPWSKCFPKATGIPADWKNVRTGMIWLDMYQFAYQNWKAGNVDDSWFNTLKKNWNWKPDLASLSSAPIQSSVFVATGEVSGESKIVIDTDNDGDVSDEKQFTPPPYDFVHLDSLSRLYKQTVKYQLFRAGRVVDCEIPLFVASDKGMLLYNFPIYAKGKINSYDIQIRFFGFMEASFQRPQVALSDGNTSDRGKSDSREIISERQLLTAGDSTYKVEGFDFPTKSLIIKRVASTDSIKSPQVNFPAEHFRGQDIISKKAVSLADLKGKWVLLDFWGSWCAPCIQEMPMLKQLYQKVDKNKIEFIGIAGRDKPDQLVKTIKRLALPWPQILSDDKNTIVEKYQIESYPTTLLINPEGVIVAKDIRGETLEAALLQFVK
ncbi:TlpA disulfide reductase family protein [Dyadobacter sp. SG02]|uniref:TlpA family protein disulfide reductase n=1 Tax=Dyadobacter sp. SG02 TaxID=1855291 RepID=UPI00115FE5D2|nr:TlpA disulfide reductase family protein [Dyadobacter sp. SG02]